VQEGSRLKGRRKETGLAISRQLVQMMDGKLNVKSTLGKGTIFSLDLDFPEVSHHANITNIEENNV
jgi:signal transduction histidine kinase